MYEKVKIVFKPQQRNLPTVKISLNIGETSAKILTIKDENWPCPVANTTEAKFNGSFDF